MKDFVFHVPTKIFFGEGHAADFANEVKAYGSKALIVYGGGSVKQNGIYDDIVGALHDAGVETVDHGGIEPNPRVDSVRAGVEKAKEHDIDIVVPIGGGSTIDAAKLIAASTVSGGEPWDIVIKKQAVTGALPIASVLTLAATGSEMDSGSVITNLETKEKLGWGSPEVLPKTSLLNPAYTKTVSPYQTASGTADIMSHTMENYFSIDDSAYLEDSFSEGLLRTCIHYGPLAVKEPDNLEARSNLMWASSWAINGLLKSGKTQSWSVHPMEHELSAYFDITHGVGLAILTPRWLRHLLSDKTAPKIARFGRRVFDIREEDDMKAAEEAIDTLYDFFKSIDIPMSLREVGVEEDALEKMAKSCIEHAGGVIRGFVDLHEDDVLAIYKACF
ncbi:MAG: iron-containing alcohol dehydrogenase [Peptoniphilus sp.]|nr:iron-containing alcohol dehydrogenase [Peptoniphilus sp.]MDD7363296.1 iron-containing alcohol dehydrogenase [Bacillota bacterium]MDY6045391.1 iron-containing alcohol dehydrogenase [Peptoniphilus sp.]